MCRILLFALFLLRLQVHGMRHTDKGNAIEFNPQALELAYMFGGLGDSVRQLVWCIAYAEENNVAAVNIYPRGWKKVEDFLDIKARGNVRTIAVRNKPADDRTSSKCYSQEFRNDLFYTCDQMSDKTRQRILMEYIRPLLSADAKNLKGGAALAERHVDELVIHIRSGDAWRKKQFAGRELIEYKMPPCAFYDKIIASGTGKKPFDRVLVVTEEDQVNPCPALIQSRHPNMKVTISTPSRAESAAALINARYLVCSQGYFSWTMAQLSTVLEHVWLADISDYGDGTLVPCGKPGNALVTTLHIPGLETLRRDLGVKERWMINYKETITETTC